MKSSCEASASKDLAHNSRTRLYVRAPTASQAPHDVISKSGQLKPECFQRPILGVYAAIIRATLDGKNPGGWFPEQKLTVAEAVEAYTLGSAYAEFQENEKGSIAPGKLADMMLLSDDIFAIDPAKIRDVTILTTWVDGKAVWNRANDASNQAGH